MTAEAIEAAAQALCALYYSDMTGRPVDAARLWSGCEEVERADFRRDATTALTAAAPFIAAQAKAEALRDAALAFDNIAVNTLVTGLSGVSSTWGNAADWLRARAATIESEAS